MEFVFQLTHWDWRVPNKSNVVILVLVEFVFQPKASQELKKYYTVVILVLVEFVFQPTKFAGVLEP